MPLFRRTYSLLSGIPLLPAIFVAGILLSSLAIQSRIEDVHEREKSLLKQNRKLTRIVYDLVFFQKSVRQALLKRFEGTAGSLGPIKVSDLDAQEEALIHQSESVLMASPRKKPLFSRKILLELEGNFHLFRQDLSRPDPQASANLRLHYRALEESILSLHLATQTALFGIERSRIFLMDSQMRLWDTQFGVVIVLGLLAIGVEFLRERRKSERKLWDLTYRDQVTGLPNENLFVDRIDSFVRLMAPETPLFGILAIGIDDFQGINTTYGHGGGNAVLTKLASRLVTETGEGNLLVRGRGDTFLVMMREARSVEEIYRKAISFRERCGEPIEYDGHLIPLSLSVGISCFPENGTGAEVLIERAKSALATARKKEGGHPVWIFDPELAARTFEAMELAQSIHRGVEREEFVLYFQPIVDIARNRIPLAEVLVRWNHPDKGLLPPTTFIPMAESNGAIVDLGAWILEAACRQGRTWNDRGFDLSLSVNASTRQIGHPGFLERVSGALGSTRFSPERLVIEITESTMIAEWETALRVTRELDRMGIALSIDDFGTGYSSLSYLNRLPIHHLKIDKSFVDDLEQNPRSREVVKGIIILSHALNILTVTEGVEHGTQRDILRGLGTDFIQGYFYSKPLPAPIFETFLKEFNRGGQIHAS